MALKIALNRVHTSLDVLIFAEFIKLENKKDIIISWNKNSNEKPHIQLYDKDGKVLGEDSNTINRYLARTMNPAFYGNTISEKTQIDHWLSIAMLLQIEQKNSLDYLNRELITRTWLVGHKLTLADIHMFSALKCQEYMKVYEKELYKDNYCNITRWYKHVKSFSAVENAISMVAKNCPLPSELKDTNLQKEKSAPKQTKARKQEGKFIDLPGAEMGKVVVRFPPEASGYLHIGHAKAALLNQYYAETFQGQLIMRFDDTNPAKETVEFEEAILEDLRLLQIKSDRFTHTSDYFEILQEYCTTLIKNGKAYVDGTPANLMKEQRDQRLKSKYRDNSIEENLVLWEEMKRGTEKGQEYCVRAKIDYQSTNGCMRDPTIYRCKPESHPRTGNKYRVYPTYDFACPIVDSIENITHTLRTTEYHDRDAQFYWIIEALELRRPYIWEYSRLNMTYTVLSKRKLTWFVNEDLVDGWDDPRFPTVRGILRRGMTVEGLKQFIIAQGSSRSVVFMEWDKIWAFNKKVIDPVAVRYTALDYDELIPVNIIDANEEWLTVQNHPKDSSKGTKRVRVGPKILIEREDAERLIEGQNATFINWGNLMIQKINRQVGNVVDVEARLNLEDKNYKNTLKITWLAYSSKSHPSAEKSNPLKCYAVYFDHIMSIPVLGKDDDFKNFVAKDTRKEIEMLGEMELKRVKKGEIIQLQRKGFFICDIPYAPISLYSSREQPIILFHIPDGHTITPCMVPAVSYNQQEDETQRVETREIIYRNPIEGIEEAKVKFGGTEVLNPIWKDKLQNVMKKAGTLMPYDTISGTLRITEGSMLYPLYMEEETMEHTYVNLENYFTHLIQAKSDRATVVADVFPLVFNEQNRKSHGRILPFKIAADNKDLENISEKISEEIQKQGDKVRNLKSSKADKSKIDPEVKILLSLKNRYKNATGQNSKPADTTAAGTVSNATTEGKEISITEKLSEEIKEQGYRVRDLKMLKDKDKGYIERQEKILLSLKSDYKNMTGQDWTPLLKEISKAEIISEEIKKQGDKVQNLKSSTADEIDQEMKFLLILKNEYKSSTGKNWKPADTTATGIVSNAKAEGKEISKTEKLSEEIKEQGYRVRDLKMLKDKDKGYIERQEKILLSLKSDYKNMTGQDWKPLLKRISRAEIISEEIKKQGDKVRNLKSSTADEIDKEVTILLSLKNEYKNATGQDWKPTDTTADSTVSNAKAEGKEISKTEKISEEIKKQGDKVRDLKSLKSNKSIIDQEVKILLSLKSDYKNATGQDWKPTDTMAASTVSNAKVERQEISNAEKISEEIKKQGDKVRYLKSLKSDKSIIDQELKILLSLKSDYKNATGQDWKPTDTVAASTVSNAKAERLEISKAEKISEEIKKQGDKVRDLKSLKSDKSIIDQEVKILLSLKSDYKNATGQDWKPTDTVAANTVSNAKAERQEISKAEKISEEIKKQGDKVRDLKSLKSDKSIIDQEVKILLSLKSDYKNATGRDWKPTDITADSTVSNAKAERQEISKAEKISEEIKKQGDKVRDLKSLKSNKSIIDQEVKILLNLKNDYKNVTSQDWKPETKVGNIVSNTQTDDNKAKELFERFQKKGHNLKYLQGILEFEMDMLWNLKKAYESTFGRDWKPIKTRAANTIVSNTKPENKEISKVETISEEIKKQGDKVRNLKNSKADKSIIDQEVKILLNLKSDYKNATGQDWRPANSEAALKKEKQSTPKPGRTSEKEVAKNVDSKDADTSKTGTRLGLEAKKEENFFDWYSQVITKSGMIEYYDVSGCYILRPWSFAIWKIIKEYIDKEITALGVQECYFPMFVTRGVLEKEKAHIADFAPEVAWVTKCGESDLAEPIAIRPTSETVMYPAYAKWLRSDTELPLRLNQWNNVVRWEFKDPKPFLRTREFLWQEGHTAFATKAEAEEEVLIILDMYARVYEDLLAVPIIKGRKTEKEKFAGGDYTTTVEAFISTSGRAIQGATSHHLGQNFSKMFNIQIEGAANGDEKTFIYQNSWGLTTRTIGVMIMVHGDDQGLVLPPNVASIQAIVIPCGVTANMSESKRKELQAECVSLIGQLSKEGKFRVKGDFRSNRTPGWKFNHWELKGVPIRIELGPRDMEKNQVTFVRRDNFERVVVKRDDVTTSLASTLNDVQEKLLLRARKKFNEHIKRVENWNDFGPELNKKNLLLSPFCGEPACEDNIKADSARENISDEPGALSMGAKSLCIPFEQPELTKPLNELKCIHHSCKNKPKFYTLFGRSY